MHKFYLYLKSVGTKVEIVNCAIFILHEGPPSYNYEFYNKLSEYPILPVSHNGLILMNT